jgi:hypothetical protein
MSFWVHGVLWLLLFLSFAPVACDLAATTHRPDISSKSSIQSDFSGVRAGASITSCAPWRITGPWGCGSKAAIKLTLIRERAAAITGVYTSVRPNAGNAFEQTGRITEVGVKGAPRLWLRVIMRDYSSCLFNSNLPDVEMEGSYLCFHNSTLLKEGGGKCGGVIREMPYLRAT